MKNKIHTTLWFSGFLKAYMPTFLKGFGKSLDIAGTTEIKKSDIPTDYEALKGDWEAINEDLKAVGLSFNSKEKK